MLTKNDAFWKCTLASVKWLYSFFYRVSFNFGLFTIVFASYMLFHNLALRKLLDVATEPLSFKGEKNGPLSKLEVI